MQTLTDLRQSLLNNYEDAKDGKMTLGKCKELANTAGKILYSVKIELDYLQYRGLEEPIQFLEPKR